MVPYCAVLDGSTTLGRTASCTTVRSVNNTITVSATSGSIRTVWSSGATADTYSGYVPFMTSGLSAISVADAEVWAKLTAPNGSGVGTVIVGRTSINSPFDSYIVKETTPGDPTEWGIYWYSDNSPETLSLLASLSPSGVTDYSDTYVRYAIVGTDHFLKVWTGTEPANTSANAVAVSDSNKTSAGEWSAFGVWGADSTGDYGAVDHAKFCVWNDLFVPVGLQAASAADNLATYDDLLTFDAPANTPLWLSVGNAKGSTADPPDSVTGTNLVIDSTVATETFAGGDPGHLRVYEAHVTADTIGGTIDIAFPANQTGCSVALTVCGAADFAGVDTEPDSGAGRTSLTVAPTFSNPYDTSGTISTLYKRTNSVNTLDTSFVNAGNTTHTNPASGLQNAYLNANDTSVAWSWTGSVRACAIAAEVQLVDPGTEYDILVSSLPVSGRRGFRRAISTR